MRAAVARSAWYAQGLRWIGSLLSNAAERVEHKAAAFAAIDPRVHREMDQYMHDVRTRAHTHI